MVCVALALSGCCAKKMSSDVAARDSMHRERREVVADSMAARAERDKVAESATEVTVVIEEEFFADPPPGYPCQGSMTGALEERRQFPAGRRRTTITAKKDMKETEKEKVEKESSTVTVTAEQEDSVGESEEHVTEERDGRTWWPWPQLLWVLLCAAVLWFTLRKVLRRVVVVISL